MMKSYIKAIGTAWPGYTTPQMEIAEFMADAFKFKDQERKKLQILYRASGIRNRSSVLQDFSKSNGQFSFFPNTEDMEPFPSVGERMEIFKEEAIKIALSSIINCFAKIPGFQKDTITHLITVSCTGLYAPGIDIEIIENLELPRNIQRSAINFMGCYAAFNALKLGDAICKSDPKAQVLIVCVELCSIHFQKHNDEDNLLANALFGDGAASVVMASDPGYKTSLMIEKYYCDLAFEGKKEMAWKIGDYGFEMKLSSYVPEIIQSGISQLTDNLLRNLDLQLKDIDYFAVHPGGKKILETIETALGITKNDNKHAYQVLKNHGNMSSPTILFVLEAMMRDFDQNDNDKKILSFAFGPGLTLESMLLQVRFGEIQEKGQRINGHDNT